MISLFSVNIINEIHKPHLELYPTDIDENASFYCPRERNQYCRQQQKVREYSWWCLYPLRFHRRLETDKYVFHCFAAQILFYSEIPRHCVINKIVWHKYVEQTEIMSTKTPRTLNFCNSVFDIVSALAIIGMMLTLVSSFFIHTISMYFKLKVQECMWRLKSNFLYW